METPPHLCLFLLYQELYGISVEFSNLVFMRSVYGNAFYGPSHLHSPWRSFASYVKLSSEAAYGSAVARRFPF